MSSKMVMFDKTVQIRQTPTFLEALGLSAVTFIPKLEKYWTKTKFSDDAMSGPGWEVISPFGEIRAFYDEREANEWRRQVCREYAGIGRE